MCALINTEKKHLSFHRRKQRLMKFLVTMKFIQPCPRQTGDFDNYEELHYVHQIPKSSGHNYHEEIICCLLVKNLNRQC